MIQKSCQRQKINKVKNNLDHTPFFMVHKTGFLHFHLILLSINFALQFPFNCLSYFATQVVVMTSGNIAYFLHHLARKQYAFPTTTAHPCYQYRKPVTTSALSTYDILIPYIYCFSIVQETTTEQVSTENPSLAIKPCIVLRGVPSIYFYTTETETLGVVLEQVVRLTLSHLCCLNVRLQYMWIWNKKARLVCQQQSPELAERQYRYGLCGQPRGRKLSCHSLCSTSALK